MATDVEHVYRISRACAADMRERGIQQWNEHYPPRAQFEEDHRNGILYVLDQNDYPIGSISLSMEKDEVYRDIKWLGAEALHLYPHRLCVEPDYQGRGFARMLMDFAEQFARDQGCASIRLDTFSQNPRNIAFYEKRGYTRLGDVYFPKQSEHPFHCFELLIASATLEAP